MTNKVYKYDIDWQITRANLKKIKSIEAKLTFAMEFLRNHSTQLNKDRVLNWAEGLRIALREDYDRAQVTSFKKEVSDFSPLITGDLTRQPNKESFNKYTQQDRFNLFRDLLVRAKKWLSKGYVNEEFDKFMKALIESLNDYDKAKDSLEAYKVLRDKAPFIPNTYKWVF